MNNSIRLITILICLIGGQLFCPSFAHGQETVDHSCENSIQVSNNPNQRQNNISNTKQNFPQCSENCGNSGSEGGGGQ